MPGEDETNKKQEKYQIIPKGDDKNSREQDTSKSTSNSEIEKSENEYNLLTESKMPDLKPITVHGVIFNDILPEYKVKEKLTITEFKIEKPEGIIAKNVIFIQNIITLNDNSIKPFRVPDFNICNLPKIEIISNNFDVSLAKTFVMSKGLSAAVPPLKTDIIKPLMEKSIIFDFNIMTEFKEFEVSKMQSIEQEPSGDPNHGGNSSTDFPWDMEIHNKLFFLGGISSAKSFKIIVVPDKEDYSEFVAMNFKDIYRNENGGYVYNIVRKKNINELREDFVKQTAMHEIVIVKIGDNILDDDRNYLINIIKNKPYQDLGLIVLAVNNIEKFREEIGTVDDILILKECDFQELLKRSKALTKIIRGFSDYPVSLGNFGDEFKNSLNEFDKKIEEYSDVLFVEKKLKKFYPKAFNYFTNNSDLLKATENTSEKEASNIHSGMKGFIYVYEIRNGSNADKVNFEDGKEKADVEIDNKRYEAETLYGRGDITALLARKMKKYKEGDKEIIFTFRNIDIIRNFFYLRNFLVQNDYKIKICGFDFVQERLISINEMIKRLK